MKPDEIIRELLALVERYDDATHDKFPNTDISKDTRKAIRKAQKYLTTKARKGEPSDD